MSLEHVDALTNLPMLIKQPAETRRYNMDFGEKLRGRTIDTTVSIAVVPLERISGAAAVTPGAQTIVGDSTSFTLTGGTTGEVYKITVIVTDSNGNTLEGDGALMVTNW